MNILKEIPDLIKAGVITQETADDIRGYYKNKRNSSRNWLFIVFGILGAMCVGLGIILIIAHNWDALSRGTKTFFAFLPLLVGQLLCGYVLTKKQANIAWKEGAATFLFFAMGACIALVSQIYHLPGNLSAFLLTWSLLCLPLIYLMKSSVVSLLYIIAITYYACETSYWSYPIPESYLYWLLILGPLPHYFLLFRRNPESNFTLFHHWLIPLSLIISLGTIAKSSGELMFIAYFSLFGLFYLIGSLDFFTLQKVKNNSYKKLGSLGTLVLLLTLSFDGFWEELRSGGFQFSEAIPSPEFLASAILSLMAGGLLYLNYKTKGFSNLQPIAFIFIIFIGTFILGLTSSMAVVLINLFVFGIGILTIRAGAKRDHLGILNYGLLIVTALVACRFFDTELSFVIRGVIFISVGIGFFAGNYVLINKRKKNEE